MEDSTRGCALRMLDPSEGLGTLSKDLRRPLDDVIGIADIHKVAPVTAESRSARTARPHRSHFTIRTAILLRRAEDFPEVAHDTLAYASSC